MRNPLLVLVGVVVALLGLLFFLQGIDLVKRSGMSGTVTWSILGPLIAAAGVAVAARGARRRAGGGDDY